MFPSQPRFIFCLVFFILSHSAFSLSRFWVEPITFSADTPDEGFSTYNQRTKMVKFARYVEKPIPIKVWKDTSAYFYFSDTATKDRFRFSVIGDYDYAATVYIQIISAKKVCIYKDSFPLMDLLSMYFDGNGQYATRIQKEGAITQYAANLLNAYSTEGALEQLPSYLDPDFTVHENHSQLSMDGAEKFFYYSKKSENYTFIGYDPYLGYALIFYETQY